MKIDAAKLNQAIELFKSGLTLQEIGDKFGVTKQAVGVRIKAYGLSRLDGGVTMIANARKKADQERMDLECLEKHGFSRQEMNAFRRAGVVKKFKEQKANAARRGIEWLLSFSQWWTAWQESGYWDKRGRPGYCMARRGDVGPYSLDNIYFCTISENISDSWISHPKSARNQHRNEGAGPL